MPNHDERDPLEGKGEEMIPDRGNPFEDSDKSKEADSEPQDEIVEEASSPEIPREGEHSAEDISSLEGESSYNGGIEFEQPPEDFPDGGMGTAAEEAGLADESIPEMTNGGMSAGYPPTRDDDLLPEPDVSVAKPEPAAMVGAPLFSSESYKQPGPLSGTSDEVTPSQDVEQPTNPEMLKLLVTDEAMKDLWIRADRAQKNVIEHIATIPHGQKMLNYIQNGKNELLGGKENFEEAERFINEVEYQVSFSISLKSLSKWFTTGLYLYEVGWAIALILFLILGIGISAAFASTKMEGTPDQAYLLSSMVWGGFGGVIGALLALTKHIAIDQDFDKQHTWWYFTSPTMGIGMGAVVYLFLHVGLFSIVGANADIASPLVIYVFAWLAGYQQNVFTDLVKRMMKTLMGENAKTEDDEEVKPTFEVTTEE
jgi:hypothetical protein